MNLDIAEREAQVRLALDRVTDPELDEPVTDLRFIEHLTVGPNGTVSIGFRLPTYWCAANFAFLMAADMQRERGQACKNPQPPGRLSFELEVGHSIGQPLKVSDLVTRSPERLPEPPA